MPVPSAAINIKKIKGDEMRKIPWPIWLAVIVGWIAATDSDLHFGPVAWLIGVGVLVIAYYAESKNRN